MEVLWNSGEEERSEDLPTQPTVSSLVRRIAALESSIHRHSSSSSSQSLRHAAARTIQTHFRAFLVRRSRTLRQLKNLASIKSTLNILKSCVSENTGFDYEAISQKATCLLLKLDCIQFDVEEGKDIEKPRISIVEKHGISQNRSGGLVKQRGGIQTKAKKSVRFAENGKVYRVLRRIQESVSNADCDDFIEGDISVDVERELKDYPQ
ncbi:BAG family molecular chaperone regulator 8 [Forsythia ovata]